ncbi:hypothetical protein HZB60_10030 [candidate division KSB1 bacterium]|nr:hypothetical protein [candidate division KSB1 bacterium]
MKPRLILLTAVGMFALLSSGCYTKFYRPGMEMTGRGPYDTLYDRYDSTAIDTTLTAPVITDEYPPRSYDHYDQWSYWGRPRTRWGFDFYNYDPSYYQSYYGYYDYYGVPWWRNWYRDPWWYYGGQPGVPGAPEQPRERGRREAGGGPGSIGTPPPPSSIATPAPANPPPQPAKPKDDNKREGKRGR